MHAPNGGGREGGREGGLEGGGRGGGGEGGRGHMVLFAPLL